MGLLIALIDMKHVSLMVRNDSTIVGLGDLGNYQICLGLLGVLLISSLLYQYIIVFSMISWTLENNWSLADHNQMILSRSFTWVINSFVGNFDASGILFGMACLAGLEDENQHVPGEIRASMGSSFGTIMDSMSYNHPC
jgi:xanthine/uracil/vitamin C permease (AzgA family)